MHKLHSVHMLKFHDWYETRNNLWLILEYCTGADLEGLVKQDGHLPETSVRIFGLDILAAIKVSRIPCHLSVLLLILIICYTFIFISMLLPLLQYVHTQNMIHCDIRPCNFLVDEYGILKLSDFKFVRKIPKEAVGDTPIASRGTAMYMAPELFEPEGVHSFQSDFWALGCVLYQMRRGSLPFGDNNLLLGELIENIRTVEPIQAPLPVVVALEGGGHKTILPPPVTADLADLLLWLLEKAPMNRCSWDTVSAHPFWTPNNPLPPTQLPAQPAFDAYIR